MEQHPEVVIDMVEYQKKACRWKLGGDKSEDPHIHEPYYLPKKIYENVAELIGNTPMVRLNNIPKAEGIQCEMLAKCDFFSPGGSAKDRIARRMIRDAQLKGVLTPGNGTIIEATSGNTGLGLAMAGGIAGYKVIITLSEKMSQEKSDVLNALGAEIVRTPAEAGFEYENSYAGMARKLQKEIKDSVILDQYVNPANSLAHYDQTAEEIWDQLDGKLDYIILTAGTGGTLMGVARKLKEKNPEINVIAVDAEGSILATPSSLNSKGIRAYKIEGIGSDFIPKTCERDYPIVDQWIKTEDKESFIMARRLIKEEGLLVGGSSGSAMCAAVQIAKNLPADKRVCVLFVDGLRNYLTKFVNDDWMLEGGFMNQEDYDAKYFPKSLRIYNGNTAEATIQDLKLKEIIPVTVNTKVGDCLEIFNNNGIECLPVLNDQGKLFGILTSRQLTNYLTSYKLEMDDAISKAVIKYFKKVKASDPMKYLSKAFTRHQFVLVEGEDQKLYVCEHKTLLNHFLTQH